MPIAIKPFVDFQKDKQKFYLVSIIYDKHVSWEFCVRVLKDIFHKNESDAMAIAYNIVNDGEGLCGGYKYEIAESKAGIVETMAKDEGFSITCLVEEV